MTEVCFGDYLYGVKAYTILRFLGVGIMRKHRVICQLEDKNPIENVQYLINLYTTVYVEKLLKSSGLSKEEQIFVVNKMLEMITENSNT